MRLNYILLPIFSIVFCTAVQATSQWTQRASFGGVGRHRATSLSIGNKAYMGLGHFNGTGVETYFSDWWEYDPSTNSWTQKVDYPGNNGNGELGAHGIGMGSVGFVGLGELNDYTLYKYDPALNTWTQMTSPVTGGTFQDTGDFTIGSKAYFIKISSSQFWEYDTVLDQWTQKSNVPFSGFFSFSGFAINGKGYMKVSNFAATINQFWEYDPVMDAWLQKTPCPGYALLSSASFVQNDKGYIICGYGPGQWSDLTSEVWEYNPMTDLWFQMPDFPGTSRRYSTGLSVGNRCYMGTGTNGTNLNDFWEFNAAAGIDQLFDENSFNVYPNPAVDYVEFQSQQSLVFDLIIYDGSGKQIEALQATDGKVKINRNGLAAGNYFYSVEVDGNSVYSNQIIFK